MPTPRCFIARHGETEWSISGKHTGTSDIPLTEDGEKRVRATGKALVGNDRLIVPKQLKHIYVSPRTRAKRTLELLDLHHSEPYPWQSPTSSSPPSTPDPSRQTSASITITPLISEWDYGQYEGITSSEIRSQRKKSGLPEKWDIWTDGCPGGESPSDIVERVDRLIAEIRSKYHAPVMNRSKDETHPDSKHDPSAEQRDDASGDVLVVAHGHILRAFAMRWIGAPLAKTAFIMEAGGVGTLSYEHGNIEEPAVLLGGGFVVGS